MTYAEKVKAGFLYRKKFKNDYSLTGFLKERKRPPEAMQFLKVFGKSACGMWDSTVRSL